jgi:hypothetical protein
MCERECRVGQKGRIERRREEGGKGGRGGVGVGERGKGRKREEKLRERREVSEGKRSLEKM